MRVIFLPDGGLQKSGGFIEVADGREVTGDEPVYQRGGYLSFSVKCRDVSIINGIEVRSEMTEDDAKPSTREAFRRIRATGDIQGSRWQQHTLSILGRESEHSSISVNIRESKAGERVYSAGVGGVNDLDVKFDETFFVEIVLTPDRMDAIIRELQMPEAELRLTVELGRFPDYYATWSPSIDEGRVVKFLSDKGEVENADDIPEEFWNREYHREALSDPDRKPVSLSVVRRIGEDRPRAEEVVDGDLDDPEEDTTAIDQVPLVVDPAGAQAITAAAAKLSRRIMFLAAAVLIGAVIIAS